MKNLKNEIERALSAIGLAEIVEHFSETVMKYALDIFPGATLPGTVALGTATYLLEKLWERGKLILGYIHHASIDELSSWMELIEQAKQDTNINLEAGEIAQSS